MKTLKIIALLVAFMGFNNTHAQDISLSTLNRFMELSMDETQSALRQWGWRVTSNETSNNKRVISYESMGRMLFYLYNYNMILAKTDVLKDYCEWLFPILENVEEGTVPKGNERADRYIGYMAETLETLYFMYNESRLNIAYAGAKILV